MKKMNRVLALLLGGAMAITSTGNLTADAIAQIFGGGEVPEGYTELETYGVTDWIAGENEPCRIFQSNEKSWLHIAWIGIRHNEVYIRFHADNSEWVPIYEKYAEELDFDRSFVHVGSFQAYDYLDENGDPAAYPGDIAYKYEILQRMCAEMQRIDPDMICSFSYRAYEACGCYGTHGSDYVYVKGTEADLEEIQECVTALDETFTVESETDGYIVHTHDEDKIFKAVADIRTAYPEAKVYGTFGVDESALPEYTLGELDILAVVQEAYDAGDINADNATDLTDAVLILQSYAESAATGAAAADMMDTNDDGSVNIDDAAKVLEMYAQNAAGLNAS